MELKEMIGKSGAVVIGTCADVDNKADIKELGRYLMDGFFNLRSASHKRDNMQIKFSLFEEQKSKNRRNDVLYLSDYLEGL